MRTTPTAALEVLLGLPPLSTIVKEAMAAFLRIRDEVSWRARGRKEGHAAVALRAEMEVPISAMRAEVFAILMVARREDVKNCTEERIFICSDSQAALRAISSPRTRSMLVQECGDALESLARQEEVELVWVPGHMGIPRNERADQLARLGSGEPPQGPEPILGISKGRINGALSR
ncbi:hypothetical protein NQ315_009147 [Exocentrus adspersus]|uniref:RNase H type-1 domain-containing protein n=1 Tax=Exocentrus adspersus TaxID=1586481 RepID=A0AAV8WG41_9CUCU|nr:hypothetical protein NQ315_009147 [Exocentrus adspersus]